MSKNLESIRAFVATDQLQIFLASFGDVEFKAAAEALRAHKRSRSKQRELEDALGHLRSAHVAFSESYQGRGFSTLAQEDLAIQMDIVTCCLMALCYRHLGEQQLMDDYLEAAQTALRHDSLSQRFKAMITPRGYIRASKQSVALVVRPFRHLKGMATNPDITKEDLVAFSANLGAI